MKTSATKRRLPHKFRFQLFHQWIINTYPPCRIADIGGGKGLLTFLLNQSGYPTTVIDPVWQPIEWKYKDLSSGKQVKLTPTQRNSPPHISTPFTLDLAVNFDLLIGLHAHGSNLVIIQAAAQYGKSFAILPCCVIDEPIVKRPGVNWFNSLVDSAQSQGLSPQVHTLNFVGQSRVIYTQPQPSFAKIEPPAT